MNAKRILALVLSVLMVMTAFAAVMSVSAEEDKFAPVNEETMQMFEGEQSNKALGSIGKGYSFGAMVSVPEGKRLTQINFGSLATYNTNENYIVFKVYQWDTDYATTVSGEVLALVSVRNHVDKDPIDIVFPTSRNMTGDLLWTATYVDGASQMTPWKATVGPVDDVVYFNQASECDAFCFSMTVADVLTEKPASYTATFVAEGNEVGKVTFFEGDTELVSVPEVPPKEGFWADWADYTLNNADITIEAVYTDASAAIKPEISDATSMSAFAENHKTYLKGTGCAMSINRDGSVSFTGTWGLGGSIDAYATINYLQLMKKYYEGYKNQSDLPNKNHKYQVVALKVKAPAISLDSNPNMTVTVGRDIDIYGKNVSNQIKCDGTEEYWLFDFSDEPDFSSDVINKIELNWAYGDGNESNLNAEFVLLGFQFFDTMEDALAATGGEVATEEPTEEPTDAPETEVPTETPTEAPTTPETEPAGGCGSVIGFSVAAILAAAAAAVALKKD